MDNNLKQPLVSIIMITKDRGDLISFAIQSVLHQDYTNWELLIIDDGSTDTTESVLKNFDDPRIKISKNQISVGITKARNQGLKLSKGEFIAVLDSDDEWSSKQKLSLQVEFLIQNPKCVVVGTHVTKINAKGAKIDEIHYPTSDSKIKETILSRNPFCHSSVLIRKTSSVYYDETLRIWEDYELFLRLGTEGLLANLEERLTNYRVHGNNISKKAGIHGAILHLKLMHKFKENYPHYTKALIQAFLRIIKTALTF